MTAIGMRFFHVLIVLCATISGRKIVWATKTIMDCNSNDHPGMWGDVDPNVFYVCDPKRNIPIQLHCPEGRGFFNGLGYYGCIPYTEWPACLPPEVRHQNEKNDQEVVQCDSEHLLEPWQSSDPNKFYMCTETAVEPVLVNCEIGKGFVSVPNGSSAAGGIGGGGGISATRSSNRQIVGCAVWAKWRSYMQCDEYY